MKEVINMEEQEVTQNQEPKVFSESHLLEVLQDHEDEIEKLGKKVKSLLKTNEILLTSIESLIRVLCQKGSKIERGVFGWKPLTFEKFEDQMVQLRKEIAQNKTDGVESDLLVVKFLHKEGKPQKSLLSKIKSAVEELRS